MFSTKKFTQKLHINLENAKIYSVRKGGRRRNVLIINLIIALIMGRSIKFIVILLMMQN